MTRVQSLFPLPTRVPIQDTVFREGRIKLRIRAAVHVDDLIVDDADVVSPPYWAMLWPSALGLARFLVRRRLREGGPALELGCGAGLPGLVLRAMGAEVVQTDLFPAALQLARWNAQRNDIPESAYAASDWQRWPLRARFPLVLGSDILYERPLHDALRNVLLHSLLPNGVAFLADPGRPPALAFAAAREAEGWSVHLHQLSERDTTIFIYELHPR
jgi:predicted nicotinamide N-methyase